MYTLCQIAHVDLLGHEKNSDAIMLLQKDSLLTSVIVLSGVHVNAWSAEM